MNFPIGIVECYVCGLSIFITPVCPLCVLGVEFMRVCTVEFDFWDTVAKYLYCTVLFLF